MRVATIASLGVSALLGVGALFVAKVWLPSKAAGPGRAAAAPAVAMTSIVAASAAVPYGTKLEAKNLTLIKVPAGSVPEGAYTSVDQVIAQDGGAPVTLTPLAAREPLLPSKVSGAGAKPSVAAAISTGMRAYTIKVNEVAGGGGQVLPGDRVDVILSRQLVSPGMEGSQNKIFVSSLVIQNVRVLAMDLIADPASVEKFNPTTATLEVTVQDAGTLAAAGQAGILSLALRRTGATEITKLEPITMRDLQRAVAVPTGDAPMRRATRSGTDGPPRSGGLIITQGGKQTTVKVPTERLGG